MVAASRGHVQARPPKRVKGGTASTRNHVFKGFSQRITQIKIEPVRRGRATLLDDAELDTAFSYFKNGFQEWREIHMSDPFTTFVRQVAPLCESLPQVLHHSTRIVDLLAEYIERGEKLSQEPLLSLTAHLAHDLGEKFDKHFERIVGVVSRLAATHPDVEVIEWSFGCLAWLFKYLSRLLVPDLRPVFNLISPLLGKERQKPFVARFAAESLSFLIRKAGAGYHRDTTPLRVIIRHVSDKLKNSEGSARHHEFEQGLMYLLADSLKGVQRGFHSSATVILQELLATIYNDEIDPLHHHHPLEAVLTAVLTACIHHSDASNFEPILEVVLAQIGATSPDPYHLNLSSRLMFVVCGTRKGDRVRDWDSVLSSLDRLLKATQNPNWSNSIAAWDYLSTVAVVFQYCALDAAVPHERLLEQFTHSPWETLFLPFCNAFADLGAERFQTFLLPYFKRFIVQKAHEYAPDLCTILPRLHHSGALPVGILQCSNNWQTLLVDCFKDLQHSTAQTHFCNAALDIIGFVQIPKNQLHPVLSCLEGLAERAIKIKDTSLVQAIDVFALGHGLQFLVNETTDHNSAVKLWPALCGASAVYGHTLAFWHALGALLRRENGNLPLEGPHMESLKQAMLLCLSSPSHDMRIAAIHILEMIFHKSENLRNIVSVVMMIEQASPDLGNQRSIAMRVNQLASLYSGVCCDEWMGMAIPAFCFGLLHVRLASVWDDTCLALRTMSDTKEGELFIRQTSLHWLHLDTLEENIHKNNEIVPSQRRYVSEFQCTNLIDLQELFTKTRSFSGDSAHLLHVSFDEQHVMFPFHNSFCRTQSLKLLNTLPGSANKMAASLVPIILKWSQNSYENLEESLSVSKEVPNSYRHWTMAEKKSLLSLFAKVSHPQGLHRASELHEALLTLLCHGDTEIQKSTLKTILAWKNPGIVAYQEQLLNLLDDARFAEELPFFLTQGGIHDKDLEQMLPIILRLLYGKVVAGKQGSESKRKTVFVGVKNAFGDRGISQFLEIATGPLNGISILSGSALTEDVLNAELVDTRKQVATLNLLDNLLSTFQNSFTPFTAKVVDPLLYCAIKATRELSKPSNSEVEVVNSASSRTSLLKTIRQRALQILGRLFESCPAFPWQPYMPAIVREIVEPRLEKLPIETAQSISGLLRLFAAWSRSLLTASFLIDYNQDILVKVTDCLKVKMAKDEVKCFALDEILGKIISMGVQRDESSGMDAAVLQNRIQTGILQGYSNAMLTAIQDILHQNPDRELLESSVQTVAGLAPYVVGFSESQNMIEIATFLLRQPSKRVAHRTKLGLLRIIHGFIQRCDEERLTDILENVYEAICPLFAIVQDRTVRCLVCDILQDLSTKKKELETIARLCQDLNSFTTTKIDVPDFERRSRAFDVINEEGYGLYTLTQWKPLVNNMLYHIRDNDELSIRVNASITLRRFIDISRKEEFRTFIKTSVLPGIRRGVQEASELVRVEYLTVLGHLVKIHDDWAYVSDLCILLSEHEESSFFSNILHIQNHRRIRALRRLAANSSALQSGNVYHLLIPLLEHFVFSKTDDDGAGSLLGETITTLTALAQGLEWSQFRALCKKYIGYLSSKEDMQKPIIRLVVGLMDSLHEAGCAKGYIDRSTMTSHSLEVASSTDADSALSTLAKTLPQQEKLKLELMNQIFPGLTGFLHKKDEATVSLRVPIATAVTKALLLLPHQEIESQLPPMLLDICHILKSRAQESRDMSRNTLSDIVAVLGPAYLGFIIKALRTALQRGYQLHVLSFTLHLILVRLSVQMHPGDLDYCLADIVDVVMDDIFGVTGQEKDAEEYISKMKEVKSSKSFDSMDLLARSATPSSLIKLVLPLRSLLTEKLNAKMVHKIDELLRRIGLGILQNSTVNSREVLMFCFELIQEVYTASKASQKPAEIDPKKKRYLINHRGASKSGARLPTSSHTYKLIRFSLDILRTVLRKHVALQTPQNLVGFLPIIGDAIVQEQEEVQTSAVRLLTLVIKVPLEEIDSNCNVYVDEALRAVKGALSPNTELAQASLKLISAILRERPNAQVKERDIGYLIKRVLPDLDQPDRSGATFGFLKAVMNRQIDIPEIYEVMDKVAEMMITNQTKAARDIARTHYFQFLTSYTQSEKRFKKQIEFLLKNLQYEHFEGRISVMEALDLILAKALPRFPEKTQYEYHGMMFLPLINVVANDGVSKCRELASLLVKRLFQHASDIRLQNFTTELKNWLEQDENTDLKRLSIQCWGFYIESTGIEESSTELTFVMKHLDAVIDDCLTRRNEEDWELLYFSLAVILKVSLKHKDAIFASNKENLWTAVQASASYPHAWVKLKAAELLAAFFTHLGISNKDTGLQALPLEGSGGLQLAEQNMIQLCNAFIRNLQDPNVTEKLCTQSVKNVAFLARCLAANAAKWPRQQLVVTEDDDDDYEDEVDVGSQLQVLENEVASADTSSHTSHLPWVKKDNGDPPAAIQHLVIRLSGIVRREATSLNAKSATMSLLGNMVANLPLDSLSTSLPHLLSTIHTFIDPTTTVPRAFTETSIPNQASELYKSLTDQMRETTDTLQKRMGTQEYLKVMSDVQKAIRKRRDERRMKRKIGAVTDPEKWELEKRRRHDHKRVKRKERGLESRGKRRGW